MSSMACSAPFLSWAPNAALPPVTGPADPELDLRRCRAGDGDTGGQHSGKQDTVGHLMVLLA